MNRWTCSMQEMQLERHQKPLGWRQGTKDPSLETKRLGDEIRKRMKGKRQAVKRGERDGGVEKEEEDLQ